MIYSALKTTLKFRGQLIGNDKTLASWHLPIGLGEECVSKLIQIAGRICFLAGGRNIRSHSLILEVVAPQSSVQQECTESFCRLLPPT